MKRLVLVALAFWATGAWGAVDEVHFMFSGTTSSASPGPSTSVTFNWRGQGTVFTDNNDVFVIPSAVRPAHLTPALEPTFGTVLTRVTGNTGSAIGVISGNWNVDARHHYSKDQPWSRDGETLAIQNGGTDIFLDGSTYAPKYGACSGISDARWNPRVPYVRIGVNGSTLLWKDVTKTPCTTVRSWALDFAPDGIGNSEGNVTSDGRYIALSSATMVQVYDMNPQSPYSPYPAVRKGTALNVSVCGIADCDIDWVSISPSGTHVVVYYEGDHPKVFDVNPATLNLTPHVYAASTVVCSGRDPTAGWIYPTGHADFVTIAGADYMVGQHRSECEECVGGTNVGASCSSNATCTGGGVCPAVTDSWVMRVKLSDGTKLALGPAGQTNRNLEAQPHHISARNLDRPGWVYVSHYKSVGDIFSDEVIALKTDGTGAVERLGHAHSDFPGNYRAEVHSVPSWDGMRVLFASNWAQDCSSCTSSTDYKAYVLTMADVVKYGDDASYGVIAYPVATPQPYSSVGPYWQATLSPVHTSGAYHYTIGGIGDHTFRPAKPSSVDSFSFYAMGDIGDSISYDVVPGVAALIDPDEGDFVIMLGDLTYGNVHGQTYVDQHFIDMEVWSRDMPYVPIWGNHEWDFGTCSLTSSMWCNKTTDCLPGETCVGAADDMRNYKGRFELVNTKKILAQEPQLNSGGEDWYWFDYGKVRFIGIPEPFGANGSSSSTVWTEWAPQAKALMDDAQANSLIQWIVTFGHRPAYSSGSHLGNSTLKCFLDKLGGGGSCSGLTTGAHSKYILNLNGHSHNFERSVPQNGVTHITSGGGGSGHAQEGACLWAEPCGGTCPCPAPGWTANRFFRHGVSKLTFNPIGTVTFQYICGPPDDEDDISCTPGDVIDEYVIPAPGTHKPFITADTESGFGVSGGGGAGVRPVTTPPSGNCGPLDLPRFVKAGPFMGTHWCCLLSGAWGQCDLARDFTADTNVTWSDGTKPTFTHTYDVLSGTDPQFLFSPDGISQRVPVMASDQDGTAKGNYLQVFDNEADLTADPVCSNSGAFGTLTILDASESGDVYEICNEKASLFRIPQISGTQAVAATQFCIGTGANACTYAAMSGDATCLGTGACTVTGTVFDTKIEEIDASPSVATARSMRTSGEILTPEPFVPGTLRLEPATANPPWLSTLRYSSQGFCTGPPQDQFSLLPGVFPTNTVMYVPIYVPHKVTVSEIGFRIQTGTGNPADVGYVGLYTRDESTGLPTTALYRTAAIPIDASGIKTDTAFNAPLDSGWYFTAFKAIYTGTAPGRIYAFTATNCLALSAGSATAPICKSSSGTLAGGTPCPGGETDCVVNSCSVGGAACSVNADCCSQVCSADVCTSACVTGIVPYQAFKEIYAPAGLPATATTSTASMVRATNLASIFLRAE